VATGADKTLLTERRAQSVFKHAILNQYLPRFIAKTGHDRGKVVLVDGFAGTGMAGNDLGSAGLMLKAARQLAQKASVQVCLVEQNKDRYGQLQALTEAMKHKDVVVDPRRGQIEDELDDILANGAVGASLFLFLDPCGAQLPFDRLVRALMGPRSRKCPPTEACLNFSAELTRRAAGQARAGGADQGGALKMDQVCGGTWWRKIAEENGPPQGKGGSWAKVAELVAREYARRLSVTTRMRSIVVPVARQTHQQPIYHLIFLTRSDHGLEAFADSIGKARPLWLESMPAEPLPAEDLFAASGLDLPSPAQDARARAERDREATVETLEGNLRTVAAQYGTFRPLDHIQEIYGSTLGVADATRLGKALRSLVADGALELVQTHKHPVQRTFRYVQLSATMQTQTPEVADSNLSG
jgi:three-Cys-motif partner protein